LTRRKIVQTELEMREYEAFRRVVEKRVNDKAGFT